MKAQNESPALNETQRKDRKPPFQIEKLEERIAPRHSRGHYGGHYYKGRCYNPSTKDGC